MVSHSLVLFPAGEPASLSSLPDVVNACLGLLPSRKPASLFPDPEMADSSPPCLRNSRAARKSGIPTLKFFLLWRTGCFPPHNNFQESDGMPTF